MCGSQKFETCKLKKKKNIIPCINFLLQCKFLSPLLSIRFISFASLQNSRFPCDYDDRCNVRKETFNDSCDLYCWPVAIYRNDSSERKQWPRDPASNESTTGHGSASCGSFGSIWSLPTFLEHLFSAIAAIVAINGMGCWILSYQLILTGLMTQRSVKILVIYFSANS